MAEGKVAGVLITHLQGKRGKKPTALCRPQCLEHGLEWARGSRGPAEPHTQTRADVCLRLDADLRLKGGPPGLVMPTAPCKVSGI